MQHFQPAPGSFTTPGKPFRPTEQAVASPIKANLNIELRRNFYDKVGKDVTPDTKDKQANGEEVGANGASGQENGSKVADELPKEPKKAVYCYSCGVDTTRIRFHYAKSTAAKVKYDLCPNCFLQGKYAASHDGPDFVKLEEENYSFQTDQDTPWTDAELLLLLEALELFDEKWDSVADHVGTRTREECAMKFLQLEIEDPYLEEGASASLTYGALNHGRIPITQVNNPVMSVISFLTGMSEPSVTAAAAGKSVEEMGKILRKKIENSSSSSQEKGKDNFKSEDSMEVDDATLTEGPTTAQAGSHNQIAHAKPSPPVTLPTIALAASAARAAALASHEEREMTRLVSGAVNTVLQKFELKLKQFSEMESIIQTERRDLDHERQNLFLERLAFKKKMRDLQEGMRQAKIRGGEEGIQMAKEVIDGGMGGFSTGGADGGRIGFSNGKASGGGGDAKGDIRPVEGGTVLEV